MIGGWLNCLSMSCEARVIICNDRNPGIFTEHKKRNQIFWVFYTLQVRFKNQDAQLKKDMFKKFELYMIFKGFCPNVCKKEEKATKLWQILARNLFFSFTQTHWLGLLFLFIGTNMVEEVVSCEIFVIWTEIFSPSLFLLILQSKIGTNNISIKIINVLESFLNFCWIQKSVL